MPSKSWLAKQRQVKIYMTIAEHEALKRDARNAGLTVSDFIKNALRRPG